MAEGDLQSDRLRHYLRQLSPQERSHLLAEMERLQLYGETVDGADLVLAELRAQLHDGAPAVDARVDIASRFFFQPLEPVLVDQPPERAGCGQISRGSLSAIWDWMTSNLLRAMASGYMVEVKRLAAANDANGAQRAAAAFQAKAIRVLDDILASPNGAEQIRTGLAAYTSHAASTDLVKMLAVLRARDTLARFAKALPTKIRRLEAAPLEKIRTLLDTVRAEHEDAVPFALTIVARRLKTPWQLVRLATKIAGSKEAADVAATPYAAAVSLALDEIESKQLTLRKALKSKRIALARDILVEVYDIEYALRVRIDHLDQSAWGKRLDGLIAAVAEAVASEVTTIPDNLNHILDSHRLHRHESLKGRLIYLTWKVRDALHAVFAAVLRLLHPPVKVH